MKKAKKEDSLGGAPDSQLATTKVVQGRLDGWMEKRGTQLAMDQ